MTPFKSEFADLDSVLENRHTGQWTQINTWRQMKLPNTHTHTHTDPVNPREQLGHRAGLDVGGK